MLFCPFCPCCPSDRAVKTKIYTENVSLFINRLNESSEREKQLVGGFKTVLEKIRLFQTKVQQNQSTVVYCYEELLLF